MKVPYLLLKLLPTWQYECPRCGEFLGYEVVEKCSKCEASFTPEQARVPPQFLKAKSEKDEEWLRLSKYIHEKVFPRVTSWQREYLTEFFTVIFKTGFEVSDCATLNFCEWTGTVVDGDAILQVQNTVKHHGTYAMQSWVTDIVLDNAYCYYTLSPVQTEIYVRIYFQVYETVIVTGRHAYILELRGNSDQYILAALAIRGDGTDSHVFLVWWDNVAFGTSIEDAIVTGQWYCYEMRVKMSTVGGGSNGAFEAWLEGVSIYSDTTIDNDDQASSMDTVRVGSQPPGAGSGSNFGSYIDCVVISDTYIGKEVDFGGGFNPVQASKIILGV